jgi:hypothetical protein
MGGHITKQYLNIKHYLKIKMSKRQEQKRREGVVSTFEKKLWQVNYELCKSMRGEKCDNIAADCPYQFSVRGILLHWLGNKHK